MKDIHEQSVKNFFDTPINYLHKSFGIRLRKELVGKLIQDKSYHEVLDVGCGDGSLSLPYLSRFDHLTLNDISPEMLKLAIENLGIIHLPNPKNKVSISNIPFQKTEFPKKFDLILMIGVLAHVKNIDIVVDKLYQLLNQNGTLIIQFSEYNHPLIRATHLFNTRGYNVNRLSYRIVRTLFRNRFKLIEEIKYLIPFPGMSLVNDEFLFQIQDFITRSKFLSSLGTDYLLKFKKV